MRLSSASLVFLVLLAALCVADELRVGFTYAKKGTNQTPKQSLEIWALQINNTGGIVLNDGTVYNIKLITYDDNENCELVPILYERLYTVDKVHVFFSPSAGACAAASDLADQYKIPMLNARNAYIAYAPPRNWTYTFTLFPPFTGVTESCTAVLATKGFLSRPLYVGCNETSGLVLPQSYSDRKYNTTYIEKLAMPSSIWSNITGTPEDQRAYIKTQVARWRRLDPSAMVWSGCGSVNFMDALRRTKWSPPIIYSFGATQLNPFRDAAGWEAEGLLSIAANDYTENFNDPVWGNTSVYVHQFKQLYNVTPDTLLMTLSALGVILSESVKIAQTLDGPTLRDTIAAYNATIFYGPVAFKNYLMARNDPCYQHLPNNTLVAVWPESYPGAKPLTYPYIVSYPEEFLRRIKKPINYALRYGLMGMGIALVVIILVALIVGLVIWKKYSIILIPNSDTNNEEWGDSPPKRTESSSTNECQCCIHL